MKILYVITRAEVGGAQVHLLDLITHLPSGLNAVIATGEPGFLCDEARRRGIPVRILPDLTRDIHPLKDLRALRAITRVIREEAPDLVHGHTSKAGLLARLAARINSTPAVFTAHTWSFADGLPLLQRLIATPLERLAAPAADRIITVSEANTETAVRHSIAGSHAFVRIWNGVPDLPGRALPGGRAKVTLITAARFAPQKDHILLLEALKGITGDWRLLLAGHGPTRGSVEKRARELGLASRIEFLGERRDIHELLTESDLFILPSKWEGFPVSILEAMRAGLPVIATATGGVAEAVTHGVNGYLVYPGDVAALRMRLQQLISFPARLARMGAASRRRYEQDFLIESMVQKTIAVYREVLALRGGDLTDTQLEAHRSASAGRIAN